MSLQTTSNNTDKSDNASKSIYKCVKHLEHIKLVPDTYVGSIEKEKSNQYIYYSDPDRGDQIIQKAIDYVPALYKIYDEILVNAEDHDARLKTMQNVKYHVDFIKINIDIKTGEISVCNSGEGIDVVQLEDYDNIYAPTMIFAKLLAGSNFDQAQKKTWGGRNGYGAKLANIFSTNFIIETIDSKRKLYFKQRHWDNMTKCSEPEIVKCSKKPFTKITFTPDYKRFGMEGMTEDIFNLFKKRAYDVAAWVGKNISVYFNDSLIKSNSLTQYANLYLPETQERYYEKLNDRWEIIVSYSNDDNFKHVSAVNGISTIRGGKHVDYIVDQLKSKLVELIKQKKKVDIRPNTVKNQLFLFVKSVIENPAFDSQTKETLTTNKSKFGSTASVSDKLIQKLMKSPIVEKIIMENEYKNKKNLKRCDGKKTRKIVGIPKLCDANFAGSSKSKDCILILTEGDSAKTTAVAGLSVVGRDYYGVFPLKGKMLNVKDIAESKMQKNEEIKNLVKILGLKYNEKYNFKQQSLWPLRYGKIMIMTDQDHDGSHIKGLVMNLFHTYWGSLFENEFISCLVTPIVKCRKGKEELKFYTLPEYNCWKDSKTEKEIKSWKIKYYKGLGTSNVTEAKEYFKYLNTQSYIFDKESSNKAMHLAFDKKEAQSRKQWLSTYNNNSTLDFGKKRITYAEFVNKEMIHFSQADNRRSIPSLCDGFKPSQRKVIFATFKKGNYDTDIKVTQLAGYVSEKSSYHHGEVSLVQTIVGLAHDFVGSNNINLLQPEGQFGTRLQGGKDASSARYIFTKLSKIAHLIIKKEDMDILEYLNDDGFPIEPKCYYPIIPMILVNGSRGIGTGFSTNIPNFNVIDIINNLLKKIDGKNTNKLKPYYKGFTGEIKEKNNNYVTYGKFDIVNENTIRITELPIGTWTEDYKSYLDSCVKDKHNEDSKNKLFIKTFKDDSTECTVNFTIQFNESLYKLAGGDTNKIYDIMKLKSSTVTNINNMVLYNDKEELIKHKTANDILDEYYDIRLEKYCVRKTHLLSSLKNESDILENKYKYIKLIIEDKLEIKNRPEEELDADMVQFGLLKIDNTYDYLTSMAMRSLTKEKVEELEKKYNNKIQEIKNLEAMTPSDIWKKELIELGNFIKSIKKTNKKKNNK